MDFSVILLLFRHIKVRRNDSEIYNNEADKRSLRMKIFYDTIKNRGSNVLLITKESHSWRVEVNRKTKADIIIDYMEKHNFNDRTLVPSRLVFCFFQK